MEMRNYVSVEKESQKVFNLKLDLKTFIEYQRQIALKYQTEEELMYETIGSKGFINTYDRYLLHCIEEISEVRDAIITHKSDNDIREEMVDVLLYLGTMTAIVKINMDRYEMKTQEELKVEFVTYRDHFNTTALFDKAGRPLVSTEVPVSIDLKLMEIVQLLIDERRLFPQRKWHKPSVNDSELQFKYKMNTLYNKNIKCIETILTILMEDRNCTERYINEMMSNKWQLVMNLPIPE